MDVFDVLVKEFDDKAAQLREAVCSGRCASFDEYKSLCGEIRGLLIARGRTLDLQQTTEKSDD